MLIAGSSEKGGSGKSAVAVGLAGVLAEAGPVLIIDLDPSAGASYAVGVHGDGAELRSFLDRRGARLESIARETSTPGLWLVAGGRALLGWAPAGRRVLGPALALAKARWKHVIIDTPPGASPLLGEALAAAGLVIVPTEPTPAGAMGPALFQRTLQLAREENPRLLERIVINRADGRLRATAEVIRHLRKTYGAAVSRTMIPSSARIVEAPSFGKPVSMHAPRSAAADAFRALARELGRVAR